MLIQDKLCFIGDSHLACIKLAINENAAFSAAFQPAFFGASGARMEALQLQGVHLVPTNDDLETRIEQVSGGVSSIEIDAYGCFILVGLGFHCKALLEMARTHGTREHARWGDVRNLMSDAAFQQTLRDIFDNMICLRIARAIRSISHAPIVLISAPAPSEGILKERDWVSHKRRLDSSYFDMLDATFRDSVLRATTCEDTHLVYQPEETLTNRLFTALPFKKQGVGFNCNKPEGYGEDEHWHMNKSYGAVVLKAAQPVIERMLDQHTHSADAA